MQTACVLICTAILLAVGFRQEGAAQVSDTTASCQAETLRGRVVQGELYEARIRGGLVFRLDPHPVGEGPQGWTIRVVPETRPDTDYSWVATPPYRYWNPRYLDTSYGVSAAETLARTPREFWFVASPEDYEAATEALDVLLWPYTQAQAEVDAAAERLSGLTTYAGTLWVEDGSVVPADAVPATTAIAWLGFRVRLCVPTEG